jgi:hypothetical protein
LVSVDDLFHSGRWQLALITVGYMAIVYVTNRVLITSPVARRLLREVREEETNVAVHLATGKITDKGADAVQGLLDDARRTIGFRWSGTRQGTPWRIRPLVTLDKVLTARRYLHGAQETRVGLVTEEHLAIAHVAMPRLRAVDWPFASELAARLDEVVGGARSPEARIELGVLVKEALSLWFAHDDAELDTAQDAQRRSMWLVGVGIALAFVLGLAGHRVTLLFGALGGFMSPLTLVRQRRIRTNDYATSWGPILLAPVAGALTAYAGLLLLEFLSSDKVGLLGDAVRDNAWSHPTTPVALALAVLLGFSARLFSRLALAAVGAVKPGASPPAVSTDAEGDADGGDGATPPEPAPHRAVPAKRAAAAKRPPKGGA